MAEVLFSKIKVYNVLKLLIFQKKKRTPWPKTLFTPSPYNMGEISNIFLCIWGFFFKISTTSKFYYFHVKLKKEHG
jgi:hypothetical protein